MFDQIIQFFEKNPIVGVIVAITLMVIILQLNKCNSAQENLDGSIALLPTAPAEVTDKSFYDGFVGGNKLINFKCKIGDKEYYMACVKVDGCMTVPTPGAAPIISGPDCDNVALILIDKDDIESNLHNYELYDILY